MSQEKRNVEMDALAELQADILREEGRLSASFLSEYGSPALAPEEEPEQEMTDDDYLNEIEEFLMDEMVERQAEERINRMAEAIHTRVTHEFDTLDKTVPEVPKPLREEPEDIIRPAFEVGEDSWQARPLRINQQLFWAIGVTVGLILLALIYIAST